MRRFRHWTPRYIWDRLGTVLYERRRPEDPWLTKEAVRALSTYLRLEDSGLELGSGRSTAWLAPRVSRLISVEHSPEWHGIVEQKLRKKATENVEYHLFPVKDSVDDSNQPYVEFVAHIPGESLDFVLVDGMFRDYCALHSIAKLRPGGLLIIDNVNWFLASESRSPNSRRRGEPAPSKTWERVERDLSTWRSIWTSSGVTDTALFFKPLNRQA